MNLRSILLVAAGRAASPRRPAQPKEQFVPANFYWVGPYAAGGSGIAGGMLDYLEMLNQRDGGINGVKFTWQKCETEYNNARGVECYERAKQQGPTGATLIHPLSTGITYSLIERATADKIPVVSIGYGRADAADGRVFPYVFPLITTYWDQAATMVRYIGEQAGGAAEAARQEDRAALPRLGLRQGADPGAHRAGERNTATSSPPSPCRTRASSSSRSGCRCARSGPTG